jgi:hypothetical protein
MQACGFYAAYHNNDRGILNFWRFEIIVDGTVVAYEDGYETEGEAEQAGSYVKKELGIDNGFVRTYQTWMEI